MTKADTDTYTRRDWLVGRVEPGLYNVWPPTELDGAPQRYEAQVGTLGEARRYIPGA